MALIATSFLCKNIELRIRRYNNENKILYFAKFITHSLSLLSIIIFKWKNFQINVFLYKKKNCVSINTICFSTLRSTNYAEVVHSSYVMRSAFVLAK